MAIREINLVPETVLSRRTVTRHAGGWAAAYAATALCLLCVYSRQRRQADLPNNAAFSEVQLRHQIAATIAEIEQKKSDLAGLAYVRRLSASIGAAEIVGHLATTLVPEVWYTSVRMQTDDRNNTELTMAGLAYSNSELGELIHGISGDSIFQEVALRSSVKVRAPVAAKGLPPHLVRFNIQAQVSGE